MSIPGSANPLLLASAASTQYTVSRSLRFNSSDSGYCSRTFTSAGNRKTWTWAGWVKRSKTGARQGFFSCQDGGGTASLQFGFLDTDVFQMGDGNAYLLQSSAVFRDLSAWQHWVISVDTTLASNRCKVYVNGTQITAWSTNIFDSTFAQNADTAINKALVHYLGQIGANLSYLDGYLADIHFIDGQALTPSSFTETSATTGQLIPKKYTGTFGTNGFWLQFADNSSNTATTLGKDTSGNNNNWDCFNLQTTTGGPTSVAAASGALPIYNTTDTYGATKGSGTRTDSNSSTIVLAIPMDGANNGTTFTDESATIKGSGSAKTITRNGDTKTSTAQSKYYGSSGYFDGTGDYLAIASSTDFRQTGDFTMECWIYPTSVSGVNVVIDGRGGSASKLGPTMYLNGSNFVFDNGAGAVVTATGAMSVNTWYHVAGVRSGNTWTLFINGVTRGSATDTSTYTSDTGIWIGASAFGENYDGYVSDVRIYKGVAKYTSNFNPPNSTQNATVATGNDSLVDTPTSYGTDTGVGGEVRGNYATLNPLKLSSSLSLANGNLDVSASGSSITSQAFSTIAVNSGLWYFEVTVSTNTNANATIGVAIPQASQATYAGQDANSWGFSPWSGSYYLYINGVQTNPSASGLSGTGTFGFAFDASSGKFWATDQAGTWLASGNPATGANPLISSITTTNGLLASVGHYSPGSQTTAQSVNFGQRPFAYTAPSGFKALCDTNLPAPVVAKPSSVFQVIRYTGTGASATIPNVNTVPTTLDFGPDLAWIKSRSDGSWHILTDSVRGVNSQLYSNDTASQGTQTDRITSFNTDGFSLGSNASGGVNSTGTSYVAWCWDAGSAANPTTINANAYSAGVPSITSSVRANASAGFSIVTWTGNGTAGATVGHGLGAKPFLRIIKRRDAASTIGWMTFHESAPTSYFTLNSTNAATPASEAAPTSTVFSLPADANSNANGGTYVAYCFAPVAGYSSFGSYVGNGSADGPFIYTGFRPKFILVKNTSVAGAWEIYDSVRNPYNVMALTLLPNASDAEITASNGVRIDFTSNGFKWRDNGSSINGSGNTIIWAAFAESPFQYARAR